MEKVPHIVQPNCQISCENNLSYQKVNQQNKFNMNSLPVSFKGMILLEIWKKTHQNDSKLQDIKFSSAEQQLKVQKRQKQEYLVRWQFTCRKSQIISQTIDNILSQQAISKSSLYYRFKKLIKQEQQRKHEMIRLKSVNQKKTNQKVQQSQLQVKPIQKDAQINTTPILEDLQNYQSKIIYEEPVENNVSKKQKKVKLKMKPKEGLIERIQAQMSQQFKKLDKIISRVNKIQNLTT